MHQEEPAEDPGEDQPAEDELSVQNDSEAAPGTPEIAIDEAGGESGAENLDNDDGDNDNDNDNDLDEDEHEQAPGGGTHETEEEDEPEEEISEEDLLQAAARVNMTRTAM
ncbi:nucleophosmin-like [Ochlerotatus camptorhynchus]|uniref:nucleophosmin-like n=1 Tax=Ochlerotatus camptorhynchus TaxID=644619 RepID=UPI0031D1F2E5